MKTKYGQEINPDDFPYAGQFCAYVRANIDPERGMAKEREITKKRKFSVYINATAEVSATITVNAENEEEAKELAKELAKDKTSNCDWNVDDVATSSIEVFFVESCQDDN